jgi:hypothetical protein
VDSSCQYLTKHGNPPFRDEIKNDVIRNKITIMVKGYLK